ncbi:MAG TPA: nucleotide kinase [Candidatus Avoscillospira stercorigallinarum]|uniref:Nucleotide kinase n=1 Tax=Candidatus Avoscillospira stercorigallinarum TaxID=2840708 RepID=A0A9D1CP23_9FIRM|nr:nucleotide kinase [Candidatus Avoscillospira stercorigallinarum]
MTKHLFLTGVKGVGKSTLVQTLLGQYHGTLGGFYTKRVTGVIPGVYSVHLLPADRPEPPSADNLLFCCGSAGRQAAAANFDRLGCAALARSAGAGLLVMDELGPHEAEARAFRAMVLAAVEGKTPILGVLQQADSPFLAQIAAHPQVELVEITAETRSALARQLRLPGSR